MAYYERAGSFTTLKLDSLMGAAVGPPVGKTPKWQDRGFSLSHLAVKIKYLIYLQLFLNSFLISPEHYNSLANNFEHLWQEIYEELIPLLMKSLDLKPHHIVADIGSGTGLIAETIFKSFGLKDPICCVDPSPEMHQLAKKRKGICPVQKTAEEFFSDTQISQCFDMVIAVFCTHHFVDHDAVYKGIFRSLRPGGIFVQFDTISDGHPKFKMAVDKWSTHSQKASERKKFLREIMFQGKFTQKEICSPWSVTKSKLYEMFRCRYMSIFHQLSDEQIEEGIKELESESLKDVKDNELINCIYVMLLTKFELEWR